MLPLHKGGFLCHKTTETVYINACAFKLKSGHHFWQILYLSRSQMVFPYFLQNRTVLKGNTLEVLSLRVLLNVIRSVVGG